MAERMVLPPLTPRSAAAAAAAEQPSPRSGRKHSPSYNSPRRAVRDTIGQAGGAGLPAPPSFAAMYGRRTNWDELTGLCVPEPPPSRPGPRPPAFCPPQLTAR